MYGVVVFVVLAALDNVAITLVPVGGCTVTGIGVSRRRTEREDSIHVAQEFEAFEIFVIALLTVRVQLRSWLLVITSDYVDAAEQGDGFAHQSRWSQVRRVHDGHHPSGSR